MKRLDYLYSLAADIDKAMEAVPVTGDVGARRNKQARVKNSMLNGYKLCNRESFIVTDRLSLIRRDRAIRKTTWRRTNSYFYVHDHAS